MDSKLSNYKMDCAFCGTNVPFKDIDQIPLKIDKTSKNQHLFAFRCKDCELKNVKVTLAKQRVRSFTGRHKARNESSIFDVPEGD